MLKTLQAKLLLALVTLLAAVGLAYVLLTLWTTRLYMQEVQQALNEDVARHIVAEHPLIRDQQVNRRALEEVFHMLMVINPSIEVYLVDRDGQILAYSAPEGHVELETIDMAPVRRFLGQGARYPLRGDDPRHPARHKVFSAAPVRHDGRLEGYVYVVLGGEAFDSVAAMVQGSYVIRLSLAVAAAGLLAAVVAGMLAFKALVARLRHLSAAVEGFQRTDFSQPVRLQGWRRGTQGDEIDHLGAAFEAMSERIIDQIRALQQSDASRREMVANVSHDLRTPLASLQGYLETLLIKDEALDAEERRQYLELAGRHATRLGRLVGELFELATLDARDAAVQVEAFPMAELVQDVVQKFRLEAEGKGVDLRSEIPGESPLVNGDIALIERVLENLIENAIRHTEAGGSIRVKLVPAEAGTVTLVSDTGCGIAASELPRVFDRFHRGDRTDPDGAGLGLAIARRIVQLHGGDIRVRSAAGHGTTFAFQLPPAQQSG